jgi:myo-inositol-1(or 4)-monophosphatase
VPLADDALVELLHETALSVRAALDGLHGADWDLTGTLDGQHHSDLVADAAALAVLAQAEVGVLSEESGLHGGERDVIVVVDPLDGSTNASRGVPWFATSLCAVDDAGPRAALVVDLPHGRTFTAVRGGGASVDGVPLRPSGCTEPGAALVGVSGLPSRSLGWRQFRALGAAATLICLEAGAMVGDAHGRGLATLDPVARRTPVAAATQPLFEALVATRRQLGE